VNDGGENQFKTTNTNDMKAKNRYGDFTKSDVSAICILIG